MKLYSNYSNASISMSSDEDFKTALLNLFEKHAISNIVESGTYLGRGSTTLLAECILLKKLKINNFYTIEIDINNFLKSRSYLKKYDFVTPIWGLSVPAEKAILFLEQDEAIKNHHLFPEVYIDNVENPLDFYLQEINGSLFRTKNRSLKQFFLQFFEKKASFQDGVLSNIVPEIIKTKPLFLLDSAGGLGYFEFKTVLDLMGGEEFFLILDDIHHLKHFRSFKEVKENESFKLLEHNLNQGWAIAHFMK